MSAFLYYIPGGLASYRRDDLAAVGLGYAFDQPSYDLRECTRGPDRSGGAIVSAGAEAVGYYPDSQTWQPMPGRATWLGWPTASPPTPDDLARPTQLDGHWLELGDGRRWLVPVARAIVVTGDQAAWSIRLPRAPGLDSEGRWTRDRVVSRYADLWATAERFWDALNTIAPTERGVEMDIADLFDAAVLSLAANYRVSKYEAVALGLLDDSIAVRILEALVDWPTWRDYLGKNLARLAGSDTAGGPDA